MSASSQDPKSLIAPSSPDNNIASPAETAVEQNKQHSSPQPNLTPSITPIDNSKGAVIAMDASAASASDMEVVANNVHVPGEIWLQILFNLPKKDLKSARLVNAAFAEFVSRCT
jgi:hypothetical protein